MSALALNHVDHKHLSDEGVCLYILPVQLCGGGLTLPDSVHIFCLSLSLSFAFVHVLIQHL